MNLPRYYKPVFCQEGAEVIHCEYVGRDTCNHKCNLGKAYIHFAERCRTDALRHLHENGLDTMFLERFGEDWRESEFFGGSAEISTFAK